MYHHEIVRSDYQWQKWCPSERLRSGVKSQGYRGQTLLSRFQTITPVWFHIWWWNDAQSLMFAPALPELLWLPTVWRCPYIEIAFSTLDCSIVPTCGAWGSATAAERGPLKQSWAGIQHSRDDEPLGVLMQMRNVRVNGFFFFSSLGVLRDVLVGTLSLCSGNFCVDCVLIVLQYIEL